MGDTGETFKVSFSPKFWTRYRATRALTNRLWSTKVAFVFFIGVPAVLLVIALLKSMDLTTPMQPFGLPGWGVLPAGILLMFVIFPLLQMYQVWSIGRRNKAVQSVQNQKFSPEG